MPGWLVTILTLFSGPIGQLITTGLTAGGAALTAVLVKNGAPADSAATIGSGIMTAVGAFIHIFTGAQTVQISSINTNQANNVKVVAASSASPMVTTPNADR